MGVGTLLLAHAGEGATWQALLTTASLGLAGLFLLVVIGRIRIREPGDLTLPLAGVAIIASAAPIGSFLLSDWVGWAFPVGAVALLALLVTAFTDLRLTATAPTTHAAVAVAAVAAVTLYAPLTLAWHPPVTYLPASDDAAIRIVAPDDGTAVPEGRVKVEVEMTGATIGPPALPPEQIPSDPETLGRLRVYLDDELVQPRLIETCAVRQPCTSVSFDADLEPGEHELLIEYVRNDGMPLAPTVFTTTTFTVQ